MIVGSKMPSWVPPGSLLGLSCADQLAILPVQFIALQPHRREIFGDCHCSDKAPIHHLIEPSVGSTNPEYIPHFVEQHGEHIILTDLARYRIVKMQGPPSSAFGPSTSP